MPPVPEALPSGEPLPDEPWAAVTIRDLEAVRDLIRDHHPGPVDPERPAFRRWLVEGFFHAHAQAGATTTYSGYVFALRAYVNGFRDGNMAFQPVLARRFFVWPGFLVGYDGRSFRVTSREERLPNLPPVGSRLLSCDDVSAIALAESIVAPYFGNWQLEAERRHHAPDLLIDRGNPFVDRPRRCSFELDGMEAKYVLSWCGVRADRLSAHVASARGGVPWLDLGTVDGIRSFSDDGVWIVPTRLDPALADVDGQIRAIRRAAMLVIDLRQHRAEAVRAANPFADPLNWIQRIWGERYFEAHRPRAIAIDWRASASNADHLASMAADDLELATVAGISAGIRSEAVGGGIFHRVLPPPRRQRRAGRNPVRGQIFVITDGSCAGVCLETVDVLRALGEVRHVGWRTRADSLYTEIRRAPLPSGLAELSFGINVIRGRPRGHNEPHVPTDPLPPEAWNQDFDLEAWIEALAADDEGGAVVARFLGARPEP